MTLIVVSHDIPSTTRMADRAVLILKDRVLEGSPAQLRSSPDADAAEFFRDGLECAQEREKI
jgi:ABC-type transporter Mla maintaining outer membrane lipid asymmetry ATPase subunit MlaF